MKKFDNIILNDIECPYCRTKFDFEKINSLTKLTELEEKEYQCTNPKCKRKFKVEPICTINPKITRDKLTDLFSGFNTVGSEGLTVGQMIARQCKTLSEDLFINKQFNDDEFEDALLDYNKQLVLFMSTYKDNGTLDHRLTLKFYGNRQKGLSYRLEFNNKHTNVVISNPVKLLDDFYNRLAFNIDVINYRKTNLCKMYMDKETK